MTLSTAMSRRGSIEIEAEILRIAKHGTKKTWIVYNANLNFKLLKIYKNRLEKVGLIRTDDNDMVWITDKGERYLDHYGNIELLRT